MGYTDNVEFRLIEPDTDISSLKMTKYDWDFVLHGIPYYVVSIEGYVHTIGGKWGVNDMWAYPRDQEPSYENLVEFGCNEPVRWGLSYMSGAYIKTKYDEDECMSFGKTIITRNEEPFYDIPGGRNYSVLKALALLQEINEHPMELESIDYDKKVIGRKVWWRSEPGIITSYIKGQACVIIEPDHRYLRQFTEPAEFAKDGIPIYEDGDVKVEIFDKHIWWFREDD